MKNNSDAETTFEHITVSSGEMNYLVALNGSESFKRNFKLLLEHFKTFENIYNATEDKLKGVPGLARQSVTALLKVKRQFKPGLGMERIQGKNVRLVTFWDRDYPEKLREALLPPPLLYVRGDVEYDFELSLGIVGTRRASRYGREQSYRFAKELARMGFTIISGGASGIDSEAHKGAIEAGGKTIAVFGSGIDITFPQSNENLFNRIAENGALISEFPPGSQPEPYRFPVRNRIIAGLSRGILVIQAPERSGALITSDYAMELGREIMAIPDRIDNPNAKGTNQLICDGASLILTIDDILGVFKLVMQKREKMVSLPPLDEISQRIVESIGWESKHIDEIAVESKIPISELSGLMLRLQMDGYVKEVSGKRYVRLAP